LLIAKSPRSVQAVERLKRAGDVIILYDPAFPSRSLTSLTIAAFSPGHVDLAKTRHESLVVVGRYGVHWPSDELAVVLAHELVGHGVQHLEGRLSETRFLDLECEAFLWTELAYQDLGIDKLRREVVQIRRQIERRWCSGFIGWSANNQPGLNAAWKELNPDVDALIAGFARYADAIQAKGGVKKDQGTDS